MFPTNTAWLYGPIAAGAFLIPLGENNYIVGATYDWNDKSNDITEAAKQELINKLKCEAIDDLCSVLRTLRTSHLYMGGCPMIREGSFGFSDLLIGSLNKIGCSTHLHGAH